MLRSFNYAGYCCNYDFSLACEIIFVVFLLRLVLVLCRILLFVCILDGYDVVCLAVQLFGSFLFHFLQSFLQYKPTLYNLSTNILPYTVFY